MSKVRALLDVLPLLRRYEGRTIVIKYGGSPWTRPPPTPFGGRRRPPVRGGAGDLVHGGGKEISALLERLQVETHFENGYRVTDQTVLETAEMALSARVEQVHCGCSGPDRRQGLWHLRPDGGLITAPAEGQGPGAWWGPSPRWTPGFCVPCWRGASSRWSPR